VPGQRAILGLVTIMAVACSSGGDAGQNDGAPLSDQEARAAVLSELAAPPEHGSGTLRFSVRSFTGERTSTSVEGVADRDRRRYVSRMEIDRPDVQAAYDVAVVDGLRYERLLRIHSGAGSPAFKPQWSTGERWRPSTLLPSLPYVPVPYFGEPEWDVRHEIEGFDDARRRAVAEAVLSGFSRLGSEEVRRAATVRYRLTFDREKAKAVLAAELARGLVMIPPAAPEVREVDVWVDGRRRLRRYVWPISDASRLEYEFWDHGQPGRWRSPTASCCAEESALGPF
jgi:hypothetical protein